MWRSAPAFPVATIAKLNELPASAQPRAGRTLRLPEQPGTRVSSTVASTTPPATVAPPVTIAAPPAPPAVAPAAVATTVPTEVAAIPAAPEAVNKTLAEQREEVAVIARTTRGSGARLGCGGQGRGPITGAGRCPPSRVPAKASTTAWPRTRPSGVAAEETIGHYADWLGISANRLRTLNKLSAGTGIVIGRKFKLDFSKARPAQFETRRRDFHEQLEAAFFANHRIAGTQVYVARRGDSLWNVAQRNGGVARVAGPALQPGRGFRARCVRGSRS